MGRLVNGVWHDQWYDTSRTGGQFVREDASFRHWVTPDGSPGPSGSGGFAAQPGRYHLYVSYACPWAHRTLIFRALKGLDQHVDVSVVHWHMGAQGWSFDPADGVVPDPVHNARYLHQIYTAARSDYTGRVTVPVLWDRHSETIVSNESSEIIRMFNSAFDDVGATPGDFYPVHLRDEIDRINRRIYVSVNNGVYRAGFATTQSAYAQAVTEVFDTLDLLDQRLLDRPYLLGETLTEADWRLFTTLLRFDPVYVGHFKCNLRRVIDYPNLWVYLRRLYHHPNVAPTIRMDHIKGHYYTSHPTINPTGIIPAGPELDYTLPDHAIR